MASRNRADGIAHDYDRESKSQCNTQQTNTGWGSRQYSVGNGLTGYYGCAAAKKYKGEGANSLSEVFFHMTTFSNAM